jgi:PLP dependent protein
MAVGKTQPAEVVASAVGLVEAFGENRVAEAVSKRPLVAGNTPWHLVGPLQRNKSRLALEVFDCIQSVDRSDLADRLELLLGQEGRELPVLVEVNIGAEPQKSGVSPLALPALLRHVVEHCPHLHLRGLMAIPPWDEDPERSRPCFSELRRLRDAQECFAGGSTFELSMGMSGDYEIAVEEGATWIRLGRVLFGDRPGAPLGVSDPV